MHGVEAVDDAERGAVAGLAHRRVGGAALLGDGAKLHAVDDPAIAGDDEAGRPGVAAHPGLAGGPELIAGVGAPAGRQAGPQAAEEGRDPQQHLARDAVGLEGQHRLRHRDLEHLERETRGQGDALAGPEHEVGAGAAVQAEATAQGEQLQVTAAQAHQGVGLAQAAVVDVQRRRPQSADHGAVSERPDLAVGQLQLHGRAHGGLSTPADDRPPRGRTSHRRPPAHWGA